ILAQFARVSTDCGLIEMVMTQLAPARQHHRHQLVPLRLEFRVGINVEHADRPAQFGRQRLERGNQLVAQMAPLTTQNREFTLRAHPPTLMLTKEAPDGRSTSSVST